MASDDRCDSLFVCTLCGDCCKGFGGTYLSETDIVAIANHIGISPERVRAECTASSGQHRVIAQQQNGYCVFWDRVCTIHPVKPRMCRRWPFIPGVLVDVANWHAMAASCPGMQTEISDGRIIECVRRAMEKESSGDGTAS